MGSDEPGSSGNEHGHATFAGADPGGGPDPFFPSGSSPIVSSESSASWVIGFGRRRRSEKDREED